MITSTGEMAAGIGGGGAGDEPVLSSTSQPMGVMVRSDSPTLTGRAVVSLTERQRVMLEEGLWRLPAPARDEARRYIESRLRPLPEIRDVDIHSAIGAAMDRERRKTR